MYGMCGALCDGCEFIKSKNCKGCKATNGCPFGKKCWIAKYIEIGGNDSRIRKERVFHVIKVIPQLDPDRLSAKERPQAVYSVIFRFTHLPKIDKEIKDKR